MDADAPPPRLRAADPANPTRTDTKPAGTVLAIVVSTLALAALLNADVMLARAETSELGRGRDVALAFWRPVEAVGSSLGLTQPRSGLDAIQELDQTGSPTTKVLATGASRSDESSIELAAPSDAVDGARQGTLGHGPAAGEGDDGAGSPTPSVADHSTTDPAGPSATATDGPTDGTSDSPTDRTNNSASDPDESARGPGDGADPGDPAGPAGDEGPGTGPASVGPEGPTEPGAAEGGAARSGAPVADPVRLRRPTADDPLRLLVIGDSTLDPVGAALLRDLNQTGVAAGVVDFRVSSGLSRPDFFDWPAHLRQLRPQLQPEIVIIMLGANDAQAFVVRNQAVEFGSDEWFSVYRARVSALLAELTADGQWVIWIGQPAMRNDDFDERMRILNQVYAEEIGKFPTARFVDSRVLTVDDDGGYAAYLTDGGGDRFQVRRTDGVHLTPAGGDRLAPSVMAVIDHIAPLGP